MASINDYLARITSEYQGQPDFEAVVSLGVTLPVEVINILLSLTTLYDVDFAVGSQLDVIGQWVGVSRNLAIPIPGVVFSWDDTKTDGWDFGSWGGDSGMNVITVLPDDAYHTLIKARIAANSWDGTIPDAYAIWAILFPTYDILIQDNGNMTMTTALVGIVPDSVTVALFTGGYIGLRPEGVLNNFIIPVDINPLFAWDTENSLLRGWDQGSWAIIT